MPHDAILEPSIFASSLQRSPSTVSVANVTQQVYLSNGSMTILDAANVQTALAAMQATINYNAEVLRDTSDFIRWAITNEPYLVERYRAALIAKGLS
jgi:hypothetical protein